MLRMTVTYLNYANKDIVIQGYLSFLSWAAIDKINLNFIWR